jgi:hypothetical protein
MLSAMSAEKAQPVVIEVRGREVRKSERPTVLERWVGDPSASLDQHAGRQPEAQ